MRNSILVTGGAGFIGSHLADYLIGQGHHVIVLDNLSYAADLNNLSEARATGCCEFVRGDICDTELVLCLLRSHKILQIFHLAAESHVDNSIESPDVFVTTNVLGTLSLLKAAQSYWSETDQMEKARFVHISTDEVFGHLNEEDAPFHEYSPYNPSSPYSASKAASDHLAKAWFTTFGLPVIVTNCSNNYGPRQHEEKLIPTIIRNAIAGNPIPIYGTGKNIRDWLYVEDHCQGLYLAMSRGQPGESYAFGSQNEIRNIDIAKTLCRLLDTHFPRENNQKYQDFITFVEDRKGHDWRYAIATDKVEKKLGFVPNRYHEPYFLETVQYYLAKYTEGQSSNDINRKHLKNSDSINFANVELNYESFRDLAQNKNLSENERLGFPDRYRQGFTKEITKDIAKKLLFDNKRGSTFLDIGCGAGSLTSEILAICAASEIKAVLVDSPEMLQHIDKSFDFCKVPGQFPNVMEKVRAHSPSGYQSILCYSVLHYIILDHNIFDFIDAVCACLAPGGVALIGDIPNQSKRNRFFSTETGIQFHKNFMKTTERPRVDPYKIQRNSIDESVLDALVERARSNGCNGYLVPQPNTLPMYNRRDDLLIQRL